MKPLGFLEADAMLYLVVLGWGLAVTQRPLPATQRCSCFFHILPLLNYSFAPQKL